MSKGRKLRYVRRGAGLLSIIGLLVFGVTFFIQKQNQAEADASNNNLANVMPSDMTTLSLQLVYTGEEINNSVNSTQSLAITDNYFIAIQAHSTEESSGWLIATALNPSSTTPSPAWTKQYNIGHGNGATWNSKTNQLIVTNNNDRYIFNANTGSFIEKKTVATTASGIAYDNIADKYIQSVGNSNTSGRVLDSNFNSLFTFDAGHRLINQDSAYYNGYIYKPVWGGCSYLSSIGRSSDATYCSDHFGNNSNVIYQFDMTGNFVHAFYIQAGFGEIESMAFDTSGTPYLLFNSKPDSTHYSVYKITNAEALSLMNAATYKIKFSANGGTGAPSVISESVGTCSTIPSTSPTRENYSFKGWSTSNTATSADTKYAAGKSVCNIETSLQLYAVWSEEDTYTITYDANGGTGAPSAQSFTLSDGAVTLSSTRPTRENYEFKGWSTSRTATTATYAPGNAYEFTNNTTLYAVWSENSYTISFDANGGTGAPSAITYKISTGGATIPSTTPTREHNNFIGWSTDRNATSADASYNPGSRVTTGQNITLYAVWSENSRRLTFDGNGGQPTIEYIDERINTVIDYSNVTATRDGYDFLGWAPEVSIAGVEAMSDNNTYDTPTNGTLYALWGKNIAITINNNFDNANDVVYDGYYIEDIAEEITEEMKGGKDLSHKLQEFAKKYLESRTLLSKVTVPERPGYSFLGWSTSPDAKTADYEANYDQPFNSNITLYAVWTAKSDEPAEPANPAGPAEPANPANPAVPNNPTTADNILPITGIMTGAMGAIGVLFFALKRRR